MSQRQNAQQFSYGFSRMPVRDQMVFKSIVRLLDGKTQAAWHFAEASQLDLLVQGNEPGGESAHSARIILQVGATSAESGPGKLWLHWPLRANEVFERLDQATRSLALPEATSGDELVRLKVWPPQKLLQQDARYIKLATLLLSRAMSAAELSERSGIEQVACAGFVQQATEWGLLQRVTAAETPPQHPGQNKNTNLGLLERIRQRLNLDGQQGKRP
ncbi:hypothetical protein R0381_000587 [Jeongeupia wiesaeckerbachi]|uniref:hypothetical protein n=1 Tax=Jeongeupia wiesaeckerbachi TaxID=3051218 RepID=UPI003D804D2A